MTGLYASPNRRTFAAIVADSLHQLLSWAMHLSIPVILRLDVRWFVEEVPPTTFPLVRQASILVIFSGDAFLMEMPAIMPKFVQSVAELGNGPSCGIFLLWSVSPGGPLCLF